MKHSHRVVTGTVLSLVFVVVGFVAIIAAIMTAGGTVAASYTVSLVAFLVVLWLLMLMVLNSKREPERRRGR